MNRKLVILLFFLSIITANAQSGKFKHFEIDLLSNFWTPSSAHLKATNSVTQIRIGNNYISNGGINGYGTSYTPALNITYYFTENWGISLGFRPLVVDNQLSVIETDSTFANYENEGSIDNLTLGFVGRIRTSSPFDIMFGFGFDFVVNYDLMITMSTESSNPSDLEASDAAVGFYFVTGMKFKLYKFISFKTGMEFTFIPAELEYRSSDAVKRNVKTNLGGIGLQAGLSFNL
jgi:outer membrane protein W